MVKRSDSDGRDQDACPGSEGFCHGIVLCQNAGFNCEERGCPRPFQGGFDANGSAGPDVRHYDDCLRAAEAIYSVPLVCVLHSFFHTVCSRVGILWLASRIAKRYTGIVIGLTLFRR